MTDEEAGNDLDTLQKLPILTSPGYSATEPADFRLAGIDIRFGAGRRREAAAWALSTGQKVLLVTDAGLRSANRVREIEDLLTASEVSFFVLDTVTENPETDYVEARAKELHGEGIGAIIALGGGSVLDSAKALNFLLTQPGRMIEYWGFAKAKRPMLPSLAIPTTAGTGSESQAYALLSESSSGRKLACGDVKARYSRVILDPELLLTVPTRIANAAAIDAMSHAIESLVSTASNPVSRQLSQIAWSLLAPNLGAAQASDVDGLGRMSLGAYLAGAAIEQSMLGAAHASANPLTTRFGVRHGEAVGLMLPAVVRFNSRGTNIHYQQLLGVEGPYQLANRLEELLVEAGLSSRLSQLDIPRTSLQGLAEEAANEWTGDFNPRKVTSRDFEKLYQAVY